MYKETFPERIKKARSKTGFTQEEVAKEVHIPRSTIANYESGRTEPDIETLGTLIDFYQSDANWILSTGNWTEKKG